MRRSSRSLVVTLALALPLFACRSEAPTADAPTTAAADARGKSGDPDAASEAPASEALPAAEELLAAHVAAAGGSEAIAGFETLVVEGTVDAPAQKLAGTVKLVWKKGGRFYAEQSIEGLGVTRAGYDGEVMWLDEPLTGLRRLKGAEAASFIQASLMFPAHDWAKYFESAETLGKVDSDAGEVWEVKLVSAEGPDLTIGLSVSDKMMRYFDTKQVTMMGEVPTRGYTERYRKVGGYSLPEVKRSSIKGLFEMTETITKVEANVDVDDSLFAFPSRSEVVPTDPSEQAPVEAPAPSPSAAPAD